MVSFLIVNASPESRITILIGLLRVNLNVASYAALRGFCYSFLKQLRLPGADEVFC